MARDHGNWDYDHGLKETNLQRACYEPKKQISYASSEDRRFFPASSWAFDRSQNTSSAARRGYKRSANKHTRNILKSKTRQELNEI